MVAALFLVGNCDTFVVEIAFEFDFGDFVVVFFDFAFTLGEVDALVVVVISFDVGDLEAVIFVAPIEIAFDFCDFDAVDMVVVFWPFTLSLDISTQHLL